jgi:PKD repeat protein
MKKKYLSIAPLTKIICLLFLLFLVDSKAQNTSAQNNLMTLFNGSCNNLDFSSGTTLNWQGAWCKTADISNYATPINVLPEKGFNSSSSNNKSGFVHEIMTAGTDPYAPITTVPPGHTYSLRLGSDSAMKVLLTTPPMGYPYSHQMVRNTFIVSAANPAITYWNAIVFAQNKLMPHALGDQPYISFRVLDKNGNEISCTRVDLNATTGTVSGDFSKKDIGTSGEEVLYRDWKPVYIPLTSYIGQQVTIQFESSDCHQGGHCAYMYLAVDCSPIQKINVSPLSCQNDTAILTAPAGFASYFWSGPGIKSVNTRRSVTVNASGKYQVKSTVMGNSGASCEFILDTILSLTNIPPVAQFSSTQGCSGQPVTFSDQSTLNGKVTSWSWDFNNDGIEDSNIQHPAHVFDLSGTYPVKLKIEQGVCTDEISKSILVSPGYVLIITNPTDSTNASVDLTKSAVTAGSTPGAVLSYWMDAAATVPLINPDAVTKSGTYFIKIGQDACSLIKPVLVKIAVISSIRDIPVETTLFNVYPNPASQQITVEAKAGIEMNSLVIELTNVLGKQLYTYKNGHVGINFIKQLDLSELPKGIYFIRFKTNSTDHIEKIIRQ